MSKQTFEIEWDIGSITAEKLAGLIGWQRRKHYLTVPTAVREITEATERYRVEMTVCFPLGAVQLNAMAAGGWRLLDVVPRRDTSVKYHREQFYHFFERGSEPSSGEGGAPSDLLLEVEFTSRDIDQLNVWARKKRFVRAGRCGDGTVRFHFEKEQ